VRNIILAIKNVQDMKEYKTIKNYFNKCKIAYTNEIVESYFFVQKYRVMMY